MDIWQRGTSFTGLAGSDYVADRWVAWATTVGQSNYVSRQAIGDLSVTPAQAVRYSLRFGRTNGTTNTGARYLFQTLENADSVRFAGKTVTVSFYARCGANYSQLSNGMNFFVTSGTGTDQIYYAFTNPVAVVPGTTVTLSTSWQRFQATGTVNTDVTQLGFGFISAPTGTAGANDWFEVTGIQLEEGSVATSYRRMTNTIQGELAACQRYCQMYQPTATFQDYLVAGATVDQSGYARYPFVFPVPMRTAPTLTTSGTASHYGNLNSGGFYTATQVPTMESVRSFSASVIVYSNGLSTGQATVFRNAANTNGYLLFTAEL
jgi:hypothetical protein